MSSPSAEARKALAPTGKLRMGLNLGSPTHAVRDAASGELKGVGFELGAELARRLGVAAETVLYGAIGALVAGGRSGEWDVAFIGVDAERTSYLDYTAPHLELEVGYLVPAKSPIAGIARVDVPGMRIVVPKGGHADIMLTSELKHAKLVRGAGAAAAFDLLKRGEADALSANKANLFELAQNHRGFRVLDGRIGTEQLAMAIPKGRDAGLDYARAFIDEAVATGLARAAAERAGVRGTI